MIVDQKVNKQFKGVYLLDRTVDGPQIATTSKPNGFRRVCVVLFLGWKWISIAKLKKMQLALKEKEAELKAIKDALDETTSELEGDN